MLVAFEPAATCDLPTDLVLAPLPAGKQLWEAEDEFAWKKESEKGLEAQTTFGLAQNGGLVKLVPARSSSNVSDLLRVDAGWEEWCSQMDTFGGLVMLAATLVG